MSKWLIQNAVSGLYGKFFLCSHKMQWRTLSSLHYQQMFKLESVKSFVHSLHISMKRLYIEPVIACSADPLAKTVLCIKLS